MGNETRWGFSERAVKMRMRQVIGSLETGPNVTSVESSQLPFPPFLSTLPVHMPDATEDMEVGTMAPHVLFTTGYAGRTLDSFLELLNSHAVERVVDIRRNPISRKKGFSRTALSTFLAGSGVEYMHVRELGVPNDLRTLLRNGACELAEYMKGFGEYLNGESDALAELYRTATGKRCCLLCVEEDASECHRSVVADKVTSLNGRRIRIENI
jgi:hypothetical protein